LSHPAADPYRYPYHALSFVERLVEGILWGTMVSVGILLPIAVVVAKMFAN
jgi:hypothetical protein